ncbi:hypothetical protein [Thioalkalivibrio paradoxus]|uniref:Uncharacterized protein n=1 Tax=Thioalkalivibrio paradoxus ARh 1 TaxID=713585 RepID=W0DNW1_9GAMM|nr:hypothetical protein [Thioalkalivibrio paradoxus]AHF00275.1 hypothetical protein THITH_15155 [Thioalkalivibrio paradoxus ARh 1]
MKFSASSSAWGAIAAALLAVFSVHAFSQTPRIDKEVPGNAVTAKGGLEQFTRVLIRELNSIGFEVTRGYPHLWTMEDCDLTFAVTLNCYANNPASPYVLAAVQPWPEEFVDPATTNVYGKTRPGYSSTYRLDPREAIVIFGRMPPPGKYMGLQSYVFSHEWVVPEGDSVHRSGYPWITDALQGGRDRFKDSNMVHYLFSTLARHEGRVQSFSSVSNSINNVVMDGDDAGASFGEIRYFVVTPDQAMDSGVRSALQRLGVSKDHVFTEQIARHFVRPGEPPGGKLGPLGLDRHAPDFLTGLRYAMPDSQQAANAWRSRLPLTVLRVRESPFSPRPAQPFFEIAADVRDAVDEGFLSDDLDALVNAVRDRAVGGPWNLAVLEAPTMGQAPIMGNVEVWLGHFGPYCRDIGENCLGDGQDASYFFMPPQPLDSGQVYAVIGTLGIRTGNATYNGLSINDASRLKGVGNVPDRSSRSSDSVLDGSASSYRGAVANHDQFFVHFFTRDCDTISGLADGACTSITHKMVPPAIDVTAPGHPHLHGFFTAGLRSYVMPGTARGPTTTYTRDPETGALRYQRGQLPPVVLAFKPRVQ